MALPAVSLGQMVYYYPTLFDVQAMAKGNFGAIAALITAIDTTAGTIDLTVFPPGKPPLIRQAIAYDDDAAPEHPYFLLSTDNPCGAEKTAEAVIDTDQSNFEISWDNPPGFFATIIKYRVFGSTPWLTPNDPGNATGDFDGDNNYIFASSLTAGETYDVLIQNVCYNGIYSAGVIVTDTVTVAP